MKIKGLKRLRISSIETSQISDEIIDLIGSNEIIVDHLHVPLQAGSDATLKRMNRKYTTAEYLEKLMRVSKEEIIAASKKVHLDTIFLLTGSDK